MSNKNTTRIDLLLQQLKFIQSTARELIYSGAFGAGKTRAICYRLAIRASRVGAREGLCRKTVVSLKRSTLKTLLEADGSLPPVLPEGSYEYKKIDGEIKIHGGGSIMLFGMEDSARIASMNLSGVAVDECVELTEKDWTMLRGRIRLAIPELPNQLYGACNPSTPQHWIARRFGLAGGHQCQPNCEAITTTSRDNWFLPKDYVEDLETMTGVARKRYVEGLWVGSEGLVFDDWDESKFVVDEMPAISTMDRVVVGVDEGWNHPSTQILVGIKDDNVFVFDEFCERHMLEVQVVDHAIQWKEQYPEIECFMADPSCAKLRASMRQAGLDVMPAENSVFSGIQTIAERLTFDKLDRPRLSVHRSCSNLIREFGSYEWMSRHDGTLKESPKKEQDDLLDSLRYAINELCGMRKSPSIRSIDHGGLDNRYKVDPLHDERLWTEM